jgi:hypothetical protein
MMYSFSFTDFMDLVWTLLFLGLNYGRYEMSQKPEIFLRFVFLMDFYVLRVKCTFAHASDKCISDSN